MTILLDTHTFLWWITDDRQLSASARDFIRDKKNDLLLSSASAWEIAIKTSLGKLPLPESPEVFIPRHMRINQFRPLPISVDHALAVSALPHHHRDPFDRLLVAQAQMENIPLRSADPILRSYAVQILW